MKRTIIFFIIVLLLPGCRPAVEYAEINGLTQGTTYHIVVEATPGMNTGDLRLKVEALLTEVDNSLSIYNDSSVISLINSNISDKTDTLFREVFRASALISEQCNGLFDITVGPLVKAWGFGPDALKKFDETKLDSLLALVGMDKVRLEGDRIVKADPDMYIDVNAIAQGYTVDLIIEMLGRGGH